MLRARSGWPSRVLVTGGAGFIGSNVIRRLHASGVEVIALDNLSRAASSRNAAALRRDCPDGVRFVEGDVRDASVVREAAAGAGAIVHLAGQTAVTRSIADPSGDFLDNALGTFNVLEAARHSPAEPIVLYASTNKVYGGLEHLRIVEQGDHYRFADLPDGIDETHPIDLASPYACSKGAGDQYTRDYFRTYGLRTVVLRQSCVYGPHQLGAEDQGWLMWFLLAARAGRPVTLYGDGKQVRDLLYIDDLVDAYEAVVAAIDTTAGQVYNLGGGAPNSLSIWWQLAPLLAEAVGHELMPPNFGPWRTGDQRVFCSDTGKARRDLGWAPRTSPKEGVAHTVDWLDRLDVCDAP